MAARVNKPKFVRGRPLLPKFNPSGTPDGSDYPSWQSIVTANRTGDYAAETLLEVHDSALASGIDDLAARLDGELWLIAEDYLSVVVPSFRIEFTDPRIIHDRAIDYFVNALRFPIRDNGKPRKDFGHLRRGVFRLLRNRTIDALRIEYRVYKASMRVGSKQKSALRSLTRRVRKALNGFDLTRLSDIGDEVNRQIIKELLLGDQTWRQIGEPLGLSADAARKRFARFIERWKENGDERDD